MMRAASPAPTLVGMLWAVGLICLGLITWVYPGATRMYAWPWSLALGGALVAPTVIVILRAFDRASPLTVPPGGWFFAASGTATGILLSALLSPHRGPSLLWAAPLLAAIATFLAAFDWLKRKETLPGSSGTSLLRLLTVFLSVTVAVSLTYWLRSAAEVGFAHALAARNGFPLGHSNYTAGAALLLLPCAATLAWRTRGGSRGAASLAVALALTTLFTSGSRGGAIGLAALALAALALARLPARRKWLIAAALMAGAAAFILANPRTRALLASDDPAAPPNISNVQRTAMLAAGWRMGMDRPLLGWGPGTTPLVYPRYRGDLDGGVETALQLHNAPAQLWAELGGWSVAAALGIAGLILCTARATPAAAVPLAGYATFSLFDWQLDVPLFGFAVAALLAIAAAATTPPLQRGSRLARLVGLGALAAFTLVVSLGHRDPSPPRNARALGHATSLGQEPQAIALLRESLAENPDQEIAHFNLGWLLVVTDPVAAENHFQRAAQLVPDKGGVYFGLGLARLNQGRQDAAANAFALECLNDPAFLVSPWWNEPGIAATRAATATSFEDAAQRANSMLTANSWAARQLARVAALAPELGRVPDGPERTYRRERIGYPVLMRNLDLPTPIDVFVVRESVPATQLPEYAALPTKGWLPSPVLRRLLAETVSPKP